MSAPQKDILVSGSVYMHYSKMFTLQTMQHSYQTWYHFFKGIYRHVLCISAGLRDEIALSQKCMISNIMRK